MSTVIQNGQPFAYNHNKYIYIHIIVITDRDKPLNWRFYTNKT